MMVMVAFEGVDYWRTHLGGDHESRSVGNSGKLEHIFSNKARKLICWYDDYTYLGKYLR